MRPTINLATHGHLNRRALYAAYIAIGIVLIFALLMHLSYWRSSYMQLRSLQAHLTELEGQLGIDANAPPVSEAEFAAQLKEIRFSNQVIARDSYRWSQLLSQLEEVLLPAVRISSIHPLFKDGTVQLRGETRKVEDLQAFIDSLQKSPFFTDILLLDQARKEAEQPTSGKLDVISFGLQFRRGGQ